MKLIDPRKYFFLNLLSLMGWFVYTSFAYIFFIFSTKVDNVYRHSFWPKIEDYSFYEHLVLTLLFSVLAFAVCVLFFLIEFFIRRRNKSKFSLLEQVPDWLKIPYSIAFWIGIFCSIPLEGIFFIYESTRF